MQKTRRKKTITEIEEALPDLDSNKVREISDALDKVLAIKDFWSSKGGKELTVFLRNKCATSLRNLVQTAKEKPDLNVLLAIIFDYSASMDLLCTIGDISLEEELRQQLDEAVIEAMEGKEL